MTRPVWKAGEWMHDEEPHLYELCVIDGRVVGYVLQFYKNHACYGHVNGVRLGAMESVEAAKRHVESRAAGRAH